MWGNFRGKTLICKMCDTETPRRTIKQLLCHSLKCQKDYRNERDRGRETQSDKASEHKNKGCI